MKNESLNGIWFVSDLDLGNVLLFPIDDKQSRLNGQDRVGSASLLMVVVIS